MAKTLLDILPEMQVEIQESSNGRWVAACPFHEGDRDPSFTIYTHNDTYFCFGCHAWGDPVKFLCDLKGWTTKQAQEYVGVDHEYKKAEKANVIKTRDVVRTWELLRNVTEAYHANLLKTSGAISYLQGRGLTSDTIRTYRLGYTDGRVIRIEYSSDFRIAHECGLINDKGYETLNHRITIPNYADTDRVDFIMGRTVTNDRIKYLGLRMPKPIWGFAQVSNSPILFVSEGQFDWLVLKQWGFPAIVLSGSHLPHYHRSALRNKKLVYIPDNDETGMKAARQMSAIFKNTNILDYTELGVKDIGELGAKEDGEERFKQLLWQQNWYQDILLSKETYRRFLPSLKNTESLPST